MVTLALGIGANAVVFSLLNGLVLRPINVPGGKDIYQIEQGKDPSQSYPNYLDIRDRNRAFDGVAAYEIERAGLDTNGHPTRFGFTRPAGTTSTCCACNRFWAASFISRMNTDSTVPPILS